MWVVLEIIFEKQNNLSSSSSMLQITYDFIKEVYKTFLSYVLCNFLYFIYMHTNTNILMILKVVI